VDTQQLAAKVAQLETRVASLEDEGKIIKGEVKQVLTEIRSAVLARENPFDVAPPLPQSAQPIASVVPITIQTEKAPAPAPTPAAAEPEPEPAPTPAPVQDARREPVPLRQPTPQPAASPVDARTPRWSLLTISALSAWAEDAMRRLGALRVEILLDLCEASAHITPEERKALSRITEMDVPEPSRTPSTNETAAVLRELDALITDGEEEPSIRITRAA
jgi:hypothetical protein